MLPPGFVNLIASFNEAAPNCARCRIRSAIPDLNPHSHAGLYVAIEEVFEASLPLLAKLRRPALLLPGPLQVVVKAQRIVLDEGETYENGYQELPPLFDFSAPFPELGPYSRPQYPNW